MFENNNIPEANKKLANALIRLFTAEDEADHSAAMAQVRSLLCIDNDQAVELDTERVVRQLMMDVGVPDALIGHRYIVKAICLLVENPDMLHAITGELYPAVAAEYGTTASRVERAIRHAVEVSIDRTDAGIIEKYYGNTLSCHKGKPTNGEFLARMANIVRDRLKGAA